MMKQAFNFSKEWDDSDAVILVENESLHVHKSILAISSPVFKKMFSSDFKEGATNVILLPGKTKQQIIEMLSHIYPYPENFSEISDIESLLSLSREYQLDKLKERIEEDLLRRVSNVDILLLAQEFSLHRLIEKTSSSLARLGFNEIKQHPRYQEISSENLVYILQGHMKHLKEQHVREIRMIKDQFHKRQQELLDIVDTINSCWGYNKLPIRGCTCPSYTKLCSDCNSALEKFIKIKCAELIDHLHGS